MAPEAYFEVLVVTVKGLVKSGRCRMGHDRKSFFSKSNDCWQAGVQSQWMSFLVRSMGG